MRKQQTFIYIDSSEEETEVENLQHKNYLYSTQEILEGQGKQKEQNQKKKKKKRGYPYSKNCEGSYCIVNNPERHLLFDDEFEKEIAKIINKKIDNEKIKKMIAQIQEKEWVENINKRNVGYQYLLEKMWIDQKYRLIQEEKAMIAKEKNARKKEVYLRKKQQELMKEESCQLKKYAVEKREKQTKVLKNLVKVSEQFEFERVVLTLKKVREEIKQKKEQDDKKLASNLNRQKDQLEELRDKLTGIRQQKRVNKLQQRKVLSEMTKKVKSHKDLVALRLKKKEQFIV